MMPDGPTEESTDRDGAFSYAAEWHAFTHGVYAGMRKLGIRPGPLPENPEVQAEPHYWKGGYVVGTLLQLGVLFVLTTVIMPTIV